jgi:hypothetical protein
MEHTQLVSSVCVFANTPSRRQTKGKMFGAGECKYYWNNKERTKNRAVRNLWLWASAPLSGDTAQKAKSERTQLGNRSRMARLDLNIFFVAHPPK